MGATETSRYRSGRRIVIAIYLAVLALTGLFGFILGVAGAAAFDPELFGLIQLPPTPLGIALYGVVTVGVVLGALLLLVTYVSERYPDA